MESPVVIVVLRVKRKNVNEDIGMNKKEIRRLNSFIFVDLEQFLLVIKLKN